MSDGGGVVIGEEGEEEALTRAEVVGGEGVERRERLTGVDDGEEAFVEGIDGEAGNGDVFGEGRVGDERENWTREREREIFLYFFG